MDLFLYILAPTDRRGIDLISHVLPFGRLWHGEPDVSAMRLTTRNFFSRSHDSVIRAYDEGGNLIDVHEHTGDFKEW